MGLQSERVVVSSPMSFSGSKQRTMNLLWHDKSPAVKWTVGLLGVPLILLMWWPAIGLWYIVFGLFMLPWRLLRRGSRKRKRDEARHRELLDAARQPSESQSP